MPPRFEHIFFDLDGTVLDSAPGLVDILNQLRAGYGDGPLGIDEVLPSISHGINAILDTGFGPQALARDRQKLYRDFEEIYRQDCCRGASLFAGIDAVLDTLDRRGLPWSVITNKKEENTLKILRHLGLDRRLSHTLGGDSLSRCKPEPDQLRHICEREGIRPGATLMVGDNINDIAAARACGAASALALWGYLPSQDIWRHWGADCHLNSPAELTAILGQ